ncbi:aspartate/glutamate racemase family protein [Mangrovicoccus algicola]|uniref:Aspartate/glutamate racemase family protein n=1 Tax=Mangrovicoccus algicola TaxID=2771008 RepID=A0A8J6YTN8_9RHOB|nr:aspartate/glutamate racemase family protein [Mangrovicoccus algicola]MBE3639048.1 aspartate/glutamate racemase family protein [Mangrovicoccus algicola]
MPRFIGVLSLADRFPRIPGDASNSDSYPLPARLREIPAGDHALTDAQGRADPALTAAFLKAAQELAAEGAVAITSSCGFLATAQQEIAAAVPVPVLLSPLSMVHTARQLGGGRPVGILTGRSGFPGPATLAAADISPDQVRIEALETEPAFARTFLCNGADWRADIDPAAIEAAVLAAAGRLLDRAPETGAFLLEHGSLPPYAAALRRETGRPVLSILDAMPMLVGKCA